MQRPAHTIEALKPGAPGARVVSGQAQRQHSAAVRHGGLLSPEAPGGRLSESLPHACCAQQGAGAIAAELAADTCIALKRSMRIDVQRSCWSSLAPPGLCLITATAACSSQEDRHAQPVPPHHDGSAEGAGNVAAQQAADACLWDAIQIVQAVCSTKIS